MITRKDIIKELSERIYGDVQSNSIQNCTQFCDILVDIISEALDFGDKVAWKGFITIELSEMKERHGRNPKTNEVVTFPPVTSVRCKICKSIKDRVNGR